MEQDCVFCKIAEGEVECEKIWEDEDHLAFLSHKPNTEGFTVVITKEHYPSYAFEVPETVMTGLTKASRKVGKLLDKSFEDVGRTGMILEGYGVNHLHSKLFPMHGTDEEEWSQKESDIETYFEKYQGYISSHNGEKADEQELKRTAEKIRNVKDI